MTNSSTTAEIGLLVNQWFADAKQQGTTQKAILAKLQQYEDTNKITENILENISAGRKSIPIEWLATIIIVLVNFKFDTPVFNREEVKKAISLTRMSSSERDKARQKLLAVFSPDELAEVFGDSPSHTTESVIGKLTSPISERVKYLLRTLESGLYRKLWGMDEHDPKSNFNLVKTKIEQTIPVINIEGIGGIGKTSCVDYCVRRLIHKYPDLFEDVCWIKAVPLAQTVVTAKPEDTSYADVRLETILDDLCRHLGMPELITHPKEDKKHEISKLLRTAPYLIVIDNLQSPRDLLALDEYIRLWNDPTRILLTCRGTILDAHQRQERLTRIERCEIQPLSQANTLAMIRAEAKHPLVTYADDETLRPLFDLTRGHPQAINVVIGLIDYQSGMSEEAILRTITEFKQAEEPSVTQMYRNVYSLTWNSLTEIERVVLGRICSGSPNAASLTWHEDLWTHDTEFPVSKEDLRAAIRTLEERKLLSYKYSPNGEPLLEFHQITYDFIETYIWGAKRGSFEV